MYGIASRICAKICILFVLCKQESFSDILKCLWDWEAQDLYDIDEVSTVVHAVQQTLGWMDGH